MIGKMVVHNATILRSLPNFVVPCYTSQETCEVIRSMLQGEQQVETAPHFRTIP